MGHQVARAREEGTTEMETRPHRTSQTSHPSNSSSPIFHPIMTSDNTVLSSSVNLQSRREALRSESSNSSKATTASVLSTQAETPSSLSPALYPSSNPALSPSSNNPEDIDLGVDPITPLSTYILDRPSSLNQLCERLDELKDKLQSDHHHTSQYLLVRRIPVDLFSAFVEDDEALKGVRATIIYREHEILYKIMPYHYHEKISRQFDIWINSALSNMGLNFLNHDFWFGGVGRSTGRLCSKEADATFFPGHPAAGVSVSWPSLVLEVGLSESLSQLRTDAHWWYANSHHQTQLVILISANLNSHDADIEIGPRLSTKEMGSPPEPAARILTSWTVLFRLDSGMEWCLVMHWKNRFPDFHEAAAAKPARNESTTHAFLDPEDLSVACHLMLFDCYTVASI